MNENSNHQEYEQATELDGENEATVEATVEAAETDSAAQKLAEAEEKLAYLAAEFENYKRQTTRRIEEERRRAATRVFNDLLPALDNFALARQYADSAQDVQSLKTGLDFVAQQMESALQSAGLEPIPAVGQPFDPAAHDAIEEIESSQPSGQVVEETKRGYRFGGQVLRPAQVKVAK